jgi:hypothetical protein
MTEDDTADNVLISLYERYIGEPETETDVYLGFGLFFSAVMFAVLALSLFIAATSLYGIRESGYFGLAQPAYLLGMLSIPLSLLSITVLLPNERRIEWVGAAGTAVTLVAAGIFLRYYPGQWFEFGTTQTLVVVGTYAVGLAVVTASTGTALVAYRLEQARAPLPSEIEPEEDDAGESISEEQVRSDIDQAMSEVDLTLGGIEREENRRLEFTADLGDKGEFRGTDVEPEKTVSPGGVDRDVEGLQQLKSGDPQAQTSESTVDDETAALNELKKKKEQDEVPDPAANDGVLAGVLSKLGLR